jgi:hypothetical protein
LESNWHFTLKVHSHICESFINTNKSWSEHQGSTTMWQCSTTCFLFHFHTLKYTFIIWLLLKTLLCYSYTLALYFQLCCNKVATIPVFMFAPCINNIHLYYPTCNVCVCCMECSIHTHYRSEYATITLAMHITTCPIEPQAVILVKHWI